MGTCYLVSYGNSGVALKIQVISLYYVLLVYASSILYIKRALFSSRIIILNTLFNKLDLEREKNTYNKCDVQLIRGSHVPTAYPYLSWARGRSGY